MEPISTQLVVGAAVRFLLTPQQNGAPWNVTGATITFIFVRPDLTTLTKSATVASGGGYAYYDTSTSDLNEDGTWTISFLVILGGTTVESQAIAFGVYPSVAG